MLLKNIKWFFLILFICIQSLGMCQNTNSLSKGKIVAAENSYINGLSSDNVGMRANSAYYLGELKSKKAVSSLIFVVHYDKCMACRIVAALSLFKIGDEYGIQEVKKVRDLAPPDRSSNDNYVLYLSILWKEYLQNHPDDALVLKNIKISDEVI